MPYPVVELDRLQASSERCFCYFWLVATVAIRADLLFDGVLDDIRRFPDTGA